MRLKLLALFPLLILSLVPNAKASVRVVPSSRSSALLKAQSARFDVQLNAKAKMARVTETWVFQNDAPQNFEAELVCEAPRNALMTGFAYWYRGEKVIARVVEKTRAANIYNAFNPLDVPVARRRDPALAEKLAPNFLKVRIGPVDAKKPLQIELQFLQPLEESAKTLQMPLLLRDKATLTVEKFDFNATGVDPTDLRWQNGFVPHSTKPLALPLSATLQIGAPSAFSLLQSAPKSGYFAVILNEAQWKTHASWKEAREIVSKILDDKRVLVAGKFETFPPSQKLGLEIQTDPFVPKMLWMALQIEKLETDPNNYPRVLELSKASNLPSAFSSWLAIPSSERKAMADLLDPNRKFRVRADYSRLGYALAAFKAVGKTATPQYREMLAQFLKLRKEGGGDYYTNRPLSEFEGGYASAVLSDSLTNYVTTTKDLTGAKIPTFAAQFKRLGYKRASSLIADAREVLTARRVSQRIVSQARSNKPLNIAALHIPTFRPYNYEAPRLILETLAKQSVATRAKNPARARQLEVALKRVGSRIGGDVESVLYFAELQQEPRYNIVKSALEKAILAGKENTPEGQKIGREWDALVARNSVLGHAGLDLSRSIGELYVQAQLERREENPDEAKIARLDAERERLTRLSRLSAKTVADNNQYAWRSDYWGLTTLLARETLKNGFDSPRAQALEKEWRSLNQSGIDYQLVAGEQRVLDEMAGPLLTAYFQALANDDQAKATQVADQVKALEAKSHFNKSYLSNRLTAGAAARTQDILEDRIRAEARKQSPDMGLLDTLTARLAKTIEQGDREMSTLNWTYRRFWSTDSDTQKRGTALDYARLKVERMGVQEKLAVAARKAKQTENAPLATRQKAENEVAQLKQLENQLRVRMGDPLIAVKAPKNAHHVMAIFPTGELLPLRFNAQNKQWEARFDVPTHATPGDYAVQIVVVFASGARQHLTMHFTVDLQRPSGFAAWKIEGKNVIFTLQTDEQTDRVSAFLPWNQRLELRRNTKGMFQNTVALPVNYREENAVVRFVLTDKAHNRTEITLDMSEPGAKRETSRQ